MRLARDDKYKPFEARGGVMDGERLTAEQVEQVSKWPSRDGAVEHAGGPDPRAGRRVGQPVESVGGALASQIEQKGEGRRTRARSRRRAERLAEAQIAKTAVERRTAATGLASDEDIRTAVTFTSNYAGPSAFDANDRYSEKGSRSVMATAEQPVSFPQRPRSWATRSSA